MDNNTEAFEEMYQLAVKQALEGKHTSFSYLHRISDIFAVKHWIRGIRKVANMFVELYNTTEKEYCKRIKIGQTPLDLLLLLKEFANCANYYFEEINIADSMIQEYYAYLNSGHILDTLLGKIRSEDDEFDHRNR